MPTSHEIGQAAEYRAAKILGGRLTPQSGAGRFIKLDLSDRGRFVFSVKATRNIKETAMRAISRLWAEAISGTRGFAGHGDGAKPGMIFELEGELLLLIRLEDYADVATGEITPYIQSTKAQERRHLSRRNLLE